MLYFENDYCEGAHPAILQKLVETNFEKVSGYGTDPYCASAKEKIRAACACPEADVFFISGGTQANAVVIGSMLHRWEGVLAATTGHVAAHEAGAIEFTGHKVLSLPHTNGKVAAKDVENFCKTFYADANMDHGALAKAGEELENVEHAIDENEIITRMRQTNEAFTQMMKKVNSIIKFVVTGENDEEEHGCNGSCEGCSGCGHQH